MAETYTPVSYWMSTPLADLPSWVDIVNRKIKERDEAQKKQ